MGYTPAQLRLTLVPGVNTSTIDVTSETGISTRITRRVNYDVQAPVATMVTPTVGSTASGIITLRARVTGNFSSVRDVGFIRDMSGIRAGTR